MLRVAALACGSIFACAAVSAQTVTLAGSLADKALLVIDGEPHTVAVGTAVRGVRLLSVQGSEAVIEVGSERRTLSLGGAQVNLGGRADGDAQRVVLRASSGGHYLTDGSINGKAVRFLVDTGATFVTMSADQSRQLGLDHLHGQLGQSQTANGTVTVYRVTLASLRVGGVTLYNVDAVVSPQSMDQVLLGNSVLSRFRIQQDNDTLTLTKRY